MNKSLQKILTNSYWCSCGYSWLNLHVNVSCKTALNLKRNAAIKDKFRSLYSLGSKHINPIAKAIDKNSVLGSTEELGQTTQCCDDK